jgi:hypothetical protein
MFQSLPPQARPLFGGAALLAGLVVGGCSAKVAVPDDPGSGGTGSGGTSVVAGGTGGSTGGAGPGAAGSMSSGGLGSGTGGTAGGAGTSSTTACIGSPLPMAKRVVRLSEYQLFNAYTALFGATAAETITTTEDKPVLIEREFPPISSDVGVGDTMFALYDRLAQSAMSYVTANAGTLTTCGAAPSDTACVQAFLLSLAEKAYRHPLSTEEQAAITGPIMTEMTAAGATPLEVLGYGVYNVLSSPSFIYRTEFGTDIAVDGPLSPYEVATTLSMFLTDRPPDADLLAAAATNQLATQEQIRAQASRLLQTPEARANLEVALIRYFSLASARTVILNPETVPGLSVTGGLLNSIYHEGELFLRNLLWTGRLDALLTSRQSWTNAQIATEIYKVAAPTNVDADGFGLVDLPADRSGLLTLSTFLTSGARSTGTSPVFRGLAINKAVVCAVNPAFPTIVDPETGEVVEDPAVVAAIADLADKSEYEKAQVRGSNPKCRGCHVQFDAYGMVLEPYDSIGRFRTADLENRPIDATWTTAVLPDAVGGAMVTNVAETSQALVLSKALDRCMAMNFINFALTEVTKGGANNTDLTKGSQTQSCAVQGVIDAFEATDKSFTSLMREIAASQTVTARSKGL